MAEGELRVIANRHEVGAIPYTVSLALISDCHIGSSHFDQAVLERELERAARSNSRILIAGDVLDAILYRDLKRFDPRGLDRRLRHKADILGGAIDITEEIFAPYAPWMDMIGVGNHETAAIKHGGIDPVSVIIDRLNSKHGGQIRHGGYSGYYTVHVRYTTGKGGSMYATFRLRYHHGAGGNSPVTKGMTDVNRMLTWVADADVIWQGHKHNRLSDAGIMRERCDCRDNVVYEPCRFVYTGAYMKPGPACEGWTQERNFAPQTPGGATVVVTFKRVSQGQRSQVLGFEVEVRH